jgi:hypothetical protein
MGTGKMYNSTPAVGVVAELATINVYWTPGVVEATNEVL